MPPKTKTLRAECLVNFYLENPAGGSHTTWGPGSVLEEGQISPESWEGFLEDGRLILTEKPAGRVEPVDGAQLAPVTEG